MKCSCESLEARMKIVETNQVQFQELIELLEDVKSALRIFIKIGNGVKWLAILAASVSGGVMAMRKWL